MTNIFDFRPKGKGASIDRGFLKDGDDTVQFGPCGRDVSLKGSVANRFSFAAPYRCNDWNNQELANIYRVKKLLDAAGVKNNLERGLTDEGDPWCVFCTAAGDVFIHLCKVDGRYILDSPNLRAPISGKDFSELIGAFSTGALRTTTRSTKDGNARVVNLQPNGKIFLHPAVLLAALIWSIYLNSEDLVMFAPEGAKKDGDSEPEDIALVNEAALAPLSEQEEAEAALFMQASVGAEHPIGVRSSEEMRDGLSWKDAISKSAAVITPAPFAVGLSSVALALGIMGEGFFDNESTVEDPSLPAIPAVNEAEEVVADLVAGAVDRIKQIDLAAILEADFDHAVGDGAREEIASELSTELNPTFKPPASLLPPELIDFTYEIAVASDDSWVVEEVSPRSSRSPEKLVSGDIQRIEKAPEVNPQEQASEPVELAPPTSTTSKPTFDYASLFDLKSSFTVSFKTFDIAGITVEATFDLESSDLLTAELIKTPTLSETVLDRSVKDDADLFEPDTVDVFAAPTAPARYEPAAVEPTPFELIDFKAQRYINYLMSKEEDLEIFAFAQELVLIDFAAFQGSPGETFSKSWSLADGGIVSTVGSKADFIEFDLIA